MFNVADLRAEIEETFADLQTGHDGQALKQGGFRVFNPNRLTTEARKVAMRRTEAQWADADIRARILRGERPRKPGGRGRPPTRWIKVAAALGIDLWAQPMAVAS